MRRFLAFSLIAVGLCASASAQIYVSTLAGQLTAGNTDATGASAQFRNPIGVAFDATNGFVYVADQNNGSVRKIVVATGAVTTYATGLSGPWGVAVDTAGNVYVADTGNNVIRKYTAALTGSIIAGQSGVSGSADAPAGPATAATFRGPYGIAVDGAGANIYVADTGNHTIRKIVVATGVVSTLAGQAGVSGYVDSASGTPKFNNPYGLAVDGSGNVYVADTLNNVIRKVTAGGNVTTVAGSGAAGYVDSTGAGAQFHNPYGIALDGSGNLYVADTLNYVIRQIVIATQVVSTPAGSAGSAGSANGVGSNARFNGPAGIAATSAGTIFVAEAVNNMIRQGGPVVTPVIGGGGQPTSRTVTAGATNVTFTVTATGFPTLNYQWQRQAGGTGGFANVVNGATYSGATTATLTIATATAGMNADVFQCVVTNPPAAGTVTSSTATLTVNSAPVFSSAAATTFVVSALGSFTVTATGYPAPTFAASGTVPGWLSLSTAGALSGTPPLTADATSPYSFTITASSSSGTVTQTFVLTVLPASGAPLINSQTGNLTVTAGATNVTFGVTATANPAISGYRWYRVVALTSAVVDLTTDFSGVYSGANTATLTIANVTAAMNQDKFYCAVSNSSGPTNSAQSTLNVNSAPAFSSLATTTFVVSAAGNFAVTATGYPAPTFVASGTVPGWLSLSTAGALSGTPPLTADATSPYSFTITASNGIGTAATQAFVLYVSPTSGIPQINTQPANQTVAVGLSATFTVTASGNPTPTYQWYRQAAGTTGFAYLTDGGSYSGSATASLTVTGVTNAMSGDKFQCVASNAYGSQTTNQVSLTVPSVPAITSAGTTTFTVSQAGSFTVTATGGPVPTFTASGTVPGWLSLSSAGALSGTPPLTADATSPYAFTIAATNTYGTASQSFSLVVLPAPSTPIFTTQPINQTIPLGQNATYTVVVTGNPVPTYQWQRMAYGTYGWINVTDDTTYSGSATATLTVTAVTTTMNGDQFQCVATNSNGGVSSTAASLTVSLGSTFTTIAGLAGPSGVGSVDGTGNAARFNGPSGMTIDSAGNIYLADSSNHTIRRVTSAGVVTTIAGVAGSRGSADGTIDVARFNSPSAVARDSAGNIYVTDTGNNTIRKISSASGLLMVSTVAGLAGTSGSADGTGSAARFTYPYGMAIDGNGNLYIADTLNGTIRLVTPAGVVSTIAGLAGNHGSVDATGSAARFGYPYGVALDSAGTTLYVADSLNHTIRRIATGGVVTTFAGQTGVSGSKDDTGIVAQFNQPSALALDSTGNVYVADTYNSTIRKITSAGVVSTLAGLAGSPGSANGTGSAVRFNRPFGIALDSAGNVFVADTGNNTIRANGIGAVSAPQIQTQPVNVTTSIGQSAVFTVAAIGTPTPNYQWQRQPSGTSTFVNLTDDATTYSGSATATLTVNVSSVAVNGDQFQCVVSNGVAPSAVSTAATLTLNTTPTITTSPQSQTAVVASTVTLTVVATGSPAPTYQWSKNGAAIAGATNATLTLSNVQLVDAGDYGVVASNQFGSATSSLAQLAVLTTSAAPVITLQPAPQAVVVGGSVTLNALAVSSPASAYQWRLNGANIAGATSATLTLTNVQAASAGQYDVVITNSLGTVVTQAATLRVLSQSYAGIYFGSYGPGLGSYALYIRADNTGVGLFSKLPGATNAFVSYTIVVDNSGRFSVTTTTGSADRPVAADQLDVGSSGPAAAAVTTNVISGTIGNDGSVTGTISGVAGALLSGSRASSTGTTQAVAGYYQAGATLSSATTQAIVSATGQAFALTQTATAADAGLGTVDSSGRISVTMTNLGTVTATVTAATSQMTATVVNSLGQTSTFTGASEAVLVTQRLSSISTRGRVATGDSVVIAGFIITGQASKSVLIRAVGPTLANFGVSGTVALPKLDLYRVGTSAPIATNTGWTTSGNTAAITAATARSGAFALGATSADSVILTTLAPGSYTAIMSSANNTPGVGLVEVYDLSTPTVGQKMIDISTRAAVGTGDNVLIAGVYIAGSVPKRVLIRAVGPGLAPYVAGTLALPQLALYRGSATTPAAQNAGWSVSPDANAIAAASAQVAGLALTTGDAALIVSLDPGVAYTAQVTGVNGSSGIALVEIYELP